MGPNSPSKFSASKLFGFGGDSRKTEVTGSDVTTGEETDPSNQNRFSSSFSTQAIKREHSQPVSRTGLASNSQSFDEEPILGGNTWNGPDNLVEDFNETDDNDEEEDPQRKKTASNVIGFDEDF